MRYFLIIAFLTLYHPGKAQDPAHSIAIVELFTSQGCSSCPSADKLLREAVNANSDLGEVYGLSFHVSYWNRLGWKDPYSSDQYTERQKWYATKMRLGRIYTPQMVVDGQDEFVGSQKTQLTTSLKSSFSTNKKHQIAIKTIEQTEDQIKLAYNHSVKVSGGILHVALIQKMASNHVPRGENRHKTLVHSNVVRSFISVPMRSAGEVALELPRLKPESSYEIISYAQDPTNLKVIAVGKMAL